MQTLRNWFLSLWHRWTCRPSPAPQVEMAATISREEYAQKLLAAFIEPPAPPPPPANRQQRRAKARREDWHGYRWLGPGDATRVERRRAWTHSRRWKD